MTAPASAGWHRDPLTLLLAGLMLALAALMLRGLVSDMADPWRMNDDMRRVIGMRRPGLPAPPPGPAAELATYQRERFSASPPAFDALVTVVRVFGDPWPAAKWGTVLLFAAFLLPMALLGREVAGPAGLFAALALAFHADIFVDRAAGTLARGFAFPILAWLLYGLATRRDTLVLWLMVPAALLYPPVLVVGGCALVLRTVWALGAGELRARWRRLLAHAAAAAVVSLGALWWYAGAAESSRAYTYAEALHLPELSRAGRGPLRAPFEAAPRAWRRLAALGLRRQQHVPRLTAGTQAGLAVLPVVLLLGWRRVPRRLWWGGMCLLGGGAISYALARALAFRLYAPDRYLLFSLPLLTAVLWLTAGVAVVRRWWDSPRAPAAGALLAVCGALAVGGPGVAGRGAFAVPLTEDERNMIAVIRALPPDVLLSGPADYLDTVYALAQRYTYLSFETLAPLHPEEWRWMEARYRLHLAAYYAADWTEVAPLRAAGVTHMVVRVSDLLRYQPSWDDVWFEPFRTEIAGLRAANGPRGFVFSRPSPAAVVARSGWYILVDLRKLDLPQPRGVEMVP